MVNCAMYGCNSKQGRDKYSFFGIPSVIRGQCQKTLELSVERRTVWIGRINRSNLREKDITRATKVCGKHFLSGKPSALFENTHPDWAPSVLLGYNSEATEKKSLISYHRFARSEERKHKRKCPQVGETRKRRKLLMEEDHFALNAGGEEVAVNMVDTDAVQIESKSKDVGCQTDLSGDNLIANEQFEAVVHDNVALKSEVEILKSRVTNLSISEAEFKENDSKTKFYTGLPTFKVFMCVFSLVSSKIDMSHRNYLSKFQEFLIVMMRLRLGLLEQDLAYRFGVTQATVSTIFEKWIYVMSFRLEKLILWPEREILQATMPGCFKSAFGGRVAVIIDCFEIFTNRPSNLLPRAQDWSDYKHHSTVKFLIGITPQGTISFMSKAWVGRASDKCITENCGILNKILPGDVVLSDRGFNISEVLGLYRAKSEIPAYTKGRTQLPSECIENTGTIANVRIHVEGVIGLTKRKFRILQGTLPIDFLKQKSGDNVSQVERIVRVCCALVNLCPSVVISSEKDDDTDSPLQ